jgi:hypothetical protein
MGKPRPSYGDDVAANVNTSELVENISEIASHNSRRAESEGLDDFVSAPDCILMREYRKVGSMRIATDYERDCRIKYVKKLVVALPPYVRVSGMRFPVASAIWFNPRHEIVFPILVAVGRLERQIVFPVDKIDPVLRVVAYRVPWIIVIASVKMIE